MSATTDLKVQNDALRMIVAIGLSPIMPLLEVAWKEIDDRREGALCMALYMMQWADQLGVTADRQAVTDELVVMILKRWGVE
jgi:hypothetical protein